LKEDTGELWLTVPVKKKGRGLQKIQAVEIYDERDWRKKHLRSIEQNYTNAPYFDDYFPALQSIYREDHSLLVEFNLSLVRFFWNSLAIGCEYIRQSELGVEGRGTDLLVAICERLGADRMAIFPGTAKHIDAALMRAHAIDPVTLPFHPPVYPQLWGDFIYNLSALDLLFNCGPKSASIIDRRR
jgi:hypothetical protein